MTAIYKRELRSYFTSMIGGMCSSPSSIFFVGIYFMAYNLFGGYPCFSYALLSCTHHFHGGRPHPHHALHGGGPAEQDRPAAAHRPRLPHRRGAGQVSGHGHRAGWSPSC